MPHDFWTGKQVLVTDATGFFGGWLVRSLLQRDAQITAIVRNDKPESQFYEQGYDQRVRIERGSVYDAAFFPGAIESTRPATTVQPLFSFRIHTPNTSGYSTNTLRATPRKTPGTPLPSTTALHRSARLR